MNNETTVLLGPFEKGWVQALALFFFLGGLHVCCDLETIGSFYIGAFAGRSFRSSVLQIKKLIFQYLSALILKGKSLFLSEGFCLLPILWLKLRC